MIFKKCINSKGNTMVQGRKSYGAANEKENEEKQIHKQLTNEKKRGTHGRAEQKW